MTETAKGKLKIFIGYAPGVGKTYKMLEEAQALRAQGKDVVIGYFEAHERPDTICKAAGLEVIPPKKISHEGTMFEEMDADAILARRPQMCVVDEFRHTNVAGSKRARRWQDVVVLLDAGIDVMTTLDIQHLESLNDEVQHITGIFVSETVPDWLIEQADEVVMVDLTPRALLHRLERGVIYKGEEAQRALQDVFREPTLVALRELTLREAAHKVEHRIASGEAALARGEAGRELPKQERILVYLTADPKTAIVIRRAKRVSDFLGGECFAVAVQPPGSLNPSGNDNLGAVETHLNFARNLHIETRILEGKDPAHLIIDFARKNRITQIFVARPRARIFLSRDPVQKLIDSAKDMQIVIVSGRDPVQRQP
jgi:two-component system, OmpR family, sensor histidine kinase KdpD